VKIVAEFSLDMAKFSGPSPHFFVASVFNHRIKDTMEIGNMNMMGKPLG
jgi:hypothetical protein